MGFPSGPVIFLTAQCGSPDLADLLPSVMNRGCRVLRRTGILCLMNSKPVK